MSIAVAVQYDRRGEGMGRGGQGEGESEGGREGNNLNFAGERGYSNTSRTMASSLVSPHVA